jgi:spore germination protein YaaH
MRWLVIPVVIVLTACTAPPTPDPVPESGLSFTAFQSQGSDSGIMDASADAISVLAIDGINFAATTQGLVRQPEGVTVVEPSALELLFHAHENGLPAELMVGNFDNDLGDFSAELASEAFTRTSRPLAIAEIARIVEEQGWDGVNIDVEAIDADLANGLTLFARELDEALEPEKSLSIALPLKDSTAAYTEAGFDLEALSPYIDRFILMAYDQHGPWEDIPGPIAELEWQRVGLEALLETIGADRVELGVAGYGYAWGPSGSDGQLSVVAARELAGADALWDDEVGEWTATLDDGTEVWWSDIRSFRLRVDLAESHGLAGLALWSLEQGDPVTPSDLK